MIRFMSYLLLLQLDQGRLEEDVLVVFVTGVVRLSPRGSLHGRQSRRGLGLARSLDLFSSCANQGVNL